MKNLKRCNKDKNKSNSMSFKEIFKSSNFNLFYLGFL